MDNRQRLRNWYLELEKIRDKEAEYGKRAMEYIRNERKSQNAGPKDQIFPLIKPGEKAWQDWERYFTEYLGFKPLAMRRTETGEQQSMTVPTLMPEWFDKTYEEGMGEMYMPPTRPQMAIEKHPAEANYVEMAAKHGRPHGPFELSRWLTYRG